jgi:hypothetical protein
MYMYLIFLLFGIILFLLITNYDTFAIGVPYIKVYHMSDDTYQLVNISEDEPDPQDVSEPIFNDYVDDETYTIMTEIQTQNDMMDMNRPWNRQINPLIIFNNPVDDTHTPPRMPGSRTNDYRLRNTFRAQLSEIGYSDESLEKQISLMLEFSKITYSDEINMKLINKKTALRHISLRPNMVRRFRLAPELVLTGTPHDLSTLPRLSIGCAAIITGHAFNSRDLYNYLLTIQDTFNFDILTMRFNPNEYIFFLTQLLSRMNIDIYELIELLQSIHSSPSWVAITIPNLWHIGPNQYVNEYMNFEFILHFYMIIVSFIIRYDIDKAINLFIQYLTLLQLLNNTPGPRDDHPQASMSPVLRYFLWLLNRNHLGGNSRFNIQYIIDRYIDNTSHIYIGDRLLIGLVTSIQNDVGEAAHQSMTLDVLRAYLLNPYPRDDDEYGPGHMYFNLYRMIYKIIDVLYEMFNSPG